MKKLLICLLVCLSMLILTSERVYAFPDINISGGNVNAGSPTGGSTGLSDVQKDSKAIADKIIKLADMLLWVGVGVGMICIIYNAAKMATASGNHMMLYQARTGLFISLVGLALLGSVNLIIKIAFGLFKS